MQLMPLSPGAAVRLATAADNAQIMAIWNHEVQWSTATFDTEPRTLEQQEAWLLAHSDAYPVLVITVQCAVLAYGALSPYRAKPAAAFTATAHVRAGPSRPPAATPPRRAAARNAAVAHPPGA